MTSADLTHSASHVDEKPPSGARGRLSQISQRLRHGSPPTSIIVLVAATWGVTLALLLVETALSPEARSRLILMAGPHVRLLVGIPLLWWATAMLDRRTSFAARRLASEGVVADRERLARLIASSERWRDARSVAGALLVFVYAVTIAGIAGFVTGDVLRWLAPTLHPEVRRELHASLPLWWFTLVAQPILLFLFVRFLWRWLAWASVLVRLARLPMRLSATHPDRAGGIGFLQDTLDPIMLAVFAIASILSATWVDEVRSTGVEAASFAPTFLVHVGLSMLVGLAPFLFLTRRLFLAKRAGCTELSALGARYVEAFHAKWRPRAARDGGDEHHLLGNPDFQSLADLGTAYAGAEEMGVLGVTRGKALRLLLCAVAPLLPLTILQTPVEEIAQHVIELAM